jgi:glycosyltransferase involved in cell wall biosynthesis
MAHLNIVFICQTVDEDHPTLATTIDWIRRIARHPLVNNVTVLALRTGKAELPENVSVCAFQRPGRLVTALRFYKAVITAVLARKADVFLIYQGGPYPALLLPFKIFMGKPVYQWKANSYVSPQMKLYAKYCNTKVFTSTSQAFPLTLPGKIEVLGQGVDTQTFTLRPHQKRSRDIVTIGRLTPVKRLEIMLRMLDACRRDYGKAYQLDIYGPDSQEHPRYKDHLLALVRELELEAQVSFKGAVRHDALPNILSEYRVLLNCCEGGLDRAMVEAMACGVPVISTNACFAEILPQKLVEMLYIPDNNFKQQAEALHRLLSLDDNSLNELGIELRDIVVREHDIGQLIEKILSVIVNS